VVSRCLFVFQVLGVDFAAKVLVLFVPRFHLDVRLVRDLTEFLELGIHNFVDFCALGQQHCPF
jgi:hypothetical protein